MNISETKSLIKGVVRQATSIPIMLYGPPGVGKTAMVAQVAEEYQLELYTLAIPTCEAVDIRGIPQIQDNRTVWRSPLPRSGQGILLLDELTSAPPDVQVAAHHIIWRERGSDISLPAGWHVIATGNRADDKTLYRPLSAPMRNRILIVNVEPDLDAWISWAFTQDIKPEIIGFLRWRPELLVASEIPEVGAFPSPRAWARVSTLMALSLGNREVYDGVIGPGASVEFTAYLQLASQLPTIEKILKSPNKADVPTSPALLYALTSAFSTYFKSTGIFGMEYMKRLPSEYTLLYIRDIRTDIRTTPGVKAQLKNDPHLRAWVQTHTSLFQDDPL